MTVAELQHMSKAVEDFAIATRELVKILDEIYTLPLTASHIPTHVYTYWLYGKQAWREIGLGQEPSSDTTRWKCDVCSGDFFFDTSSVNDMEAFSLCPHCGGNWIKAHINKIAGRGRVE